jgi:hypothetical protein
MPDAIAIASALITRGITVAIPRISSDDRDVAIYVLVADLNQRGRTNG